MLLVLLIVAIGTTICGAIWHNETTYHETPAISVFVFGMVSGLITIFPFIIGLIYVVQAPIIDQKIEMYIEENASIELSVTTTVEKYLEHEFQIFDSLKGEDIQTLLVVYPEINSNELVKKQIEIFVDNNNKIKELKEDKLNIEVWKWWVYFG